MLDQNKLYYGNTIGDWLYAFGLILLSALVGRIVYWMFRKVLGRLTRKSKTKLDDIIVDNIEEPITFIIVLYGFRYTVSTLTFPEVTDTIFVYAFQFIITISVTWLVARLYDALHKEYLIPIANRTTTDLDDHLLPIVRKGVRISVWLLGILVALNNAGYDVTALLAGLGIGGFAFALAVQHTFGNMVSGFLIYTEGHFKVGDRIQLQGTYQKIDGVVLEVGLRTTKLKTRYEGRTVSIPNSMFTSQEVINVDSEDGRQVFAIYKLAPSTPIDLLEETLKLLEAAVHGIAGTKDFVVTGIVKVSEISIDVMLLYWVQPDSSNVKTRTAVNLEILRILRENNIAFADRTAVRYNQDVEF
ncbi:MAG: mechanosensitive ion channel family protein [Cyclobacteriaceae bacterium]|nr:mechanosensitive ion channel family protein [Cyclobacteriaceae bacterium]